MAKKKVIKKSAMRMVIAVPANGIELKLTNGKTIGTLTIEPKGVKFDGANSKLRSDRMMTWEVLKSISKSGLV